MLSRLYNNHLFWLLFWGAAVATTAQEDSNAPSAAPSPVDLQVSSSPTTGFIVVGDVDDLEDFDNFELEEKRREENLHTFAYEAIFQPPWATAVTRSLFGYKTAPTAYLFSSRMPYSTFFVSMQDVCTKVGGSAFDGGRFCIVSALDEDGRPTKKYSQLVNGVVESSDLPDYSDIGNLCSQLGGNTFGPADEFCLLEGEWTQLTEDMPGLTGKGAAGRLGPICDGIGGFRFGSNDRFCAVQGYWSQLTTQLPSISNFVSIGSTCNRLGGRTLGDVYCILEGVYSQLTTRLPGDFAWPGDFADSVCDSLGGTSLDTFCFIPGTVTQLTTKLPGDFSWTTDFPPRNCKDGRVYGRYCFIVGDKSQLSTRFSGDIGWETFFSKQACDSLGGTTLDEFCFADAGTTQLTTKPPGYFTWSTFFPRTLCAEEFGGYSQSRHCFVPGAADEETPGEGQQPDEGGGDGVGGGGNDGTDSAADKMYGPLSTLWTILLTGIYLFFFI